jgi:hypothetical protein
MIMVGGATRAAWAAGKRGIRPTEHWADAKRGRRAGAAGHPAGGPGQQGITLAGRVGRARRELPPQGAGLPRGAETRGAGLGRSMIM